jgi:hypothetical protein
LKKLAALVVFLSLNVCAVEYDIVQDLNGVDLKSMKEDAIRTYTGLTEKILPYSLELVKSGVTNFTDKCNNSYKNKRRYTSTESGCRYHNENLVETFVITDIRKKDEFQDVSEVYLLGRHVYNRGNYGYYEIVTVQNGLNKKSQKTITVTLRMLDDKEVRLYTSAKFSRESPFDTSLAIFKLTQISPEETHLSYEYMASTDHWLLNKAVTVPQVFASISKSVNDLIRTVEDESLWQKRQLTSKE